MKPERVRQAAEEADRQIRALQAVTTDEPPATGDEGGDEPTPDPAVTSGDDTTTAIEPQAPAAPDPEVDSLRAELAKSVQRYKSLEGMFRAQNQQLDQYKAQVDDLQRRLEQAPEQQTAVADEPTVAVSQDDVRLFGDDLVAFVQRVSAAAAKAATKALADELNSLKSDLDTTSQMSVLSAQDRFETQLDKLAPKWRELDTDEAFIGWLDNHAAIKRGFQEAVSTLDHQSVADVFNLYGELTSKPAEPSAADKRRQELEQQAAPPKNRQPAAPTAEPPAENVWTRSEIERVYRTRTGRNGESLTPEQFDALEREIAAAQASGRVDFSR